MLVRRLGVAGLRSSGIGQLLSSSYYSSLRACLSLRCMMLKCVHIGIRETEGLELMCGGSRPERVAHAARLISC